MNWAEEASKLGGSYAPPAQDNTGVPTPSPELDMMAEAQRLGGTYTPPQAEEPEPNQGERFRRQAGLSIRAPLRSALTLGGLTEMVGEAVPGLQGRVGPAADAALRALRLPEPETAQERLVQGGAQALAGVGVVGKAAQALRGLVPNFQARQVANSQTLAPEQGPGGMTRQLLDVLSQRLGLQAATAAPANLAGGVVREAGGSPGQELAATLGTALIAPTVATGKQAVSQRLEPVNRQFQQAGTDPSLGQLTGSRFIQNIEELGMNLPFSRPILQGQRRQQQADMGRRATEESAYVAQIGRAPAREQGAEGNVWSSERFLDNWSRMPDEAARAVAIPDPEIRAHFDNLARVAERLRTVRDNTVLARQRGRWSGPLGMVGAAFLGSITLPTAILTSMTGGARYALTNPRFTRWLSSAAESEGHDIRRRMMQLRTMTTAERDPEMRAAMDEYTANLVERLSTPEGAQRNE